MRTPRRLFDRRRPDYYDVLAVAEDAPLHEIESAYWRRACSRSDRDDLPLLNAAYAVLAHQERRQGRGTRAEALAHRFRAGGPPGGHST